MPEQNEMKPETARLVLDAAREAFGAEERRSYSLLSKAQTQATISSIFFAALAILKFKVQKAETISQIAIGFGFASMFFCILVIRNREFHRNRLPDTKAVTTYNVSEAKMAAELAETYRDASDQNRPILNQLYTKFQIAAVLSLISVVLGVAALIVENWRP